MRHVQSTSRSPVVLEYEVLDGIGVEGDEARLAAPRSERCQ